MTEHGACDLHQLVTFYGSLKEMQIKLIFFNLLLAINYIHSAEIVLRTLTAQNILVNSDLSIRIIDFGNAKSLIQTERAGCGKLIKEELDTSESVLNKIGDTFSRCFGEESLANTQSSYGIGTQSTASSECLQEPKGDSPLGELNSDPTQDHDLRIPENPYKLSIQIKPQTDPMPLRHKLGDEKMTSSQIIEKNEETKETARNLDYLDKLSERLESIRNDQDKMEKGPLTQWSKVREDQLQWCLEDMGAFYSSLALPPKPYRGFVGERYYRAPELIVLQQTTIKPADIWSLGCILAQLISAANPARDANTQNIVFEELETLLFKGDSCFPMSPKKEKQSIFKDFHASKLDQMNLYLKKIGKPCAKDIELINDSNAKKYMEGFRDYKRVDWTKEFPYIRDKRVFSLLDHILMFNPQKRYSIKGCLLHPYFADLIKTGDIKDYESWDIRKLCKPTDNKRNRLENIWEYKNVENCQLKTSQFWNEVRKGMHVRQREYGGPRNRWEKVEEETRLVKKLGSTYLLELMKELDNY